MIPRTLRDLLITTTILIGFGARAQQHCLTWQWLNLACQTTLSCDIGCSACDLPVASGAALIGTDGAYVGVTTCPRPFAAGDNAIFSEGWAGTVKEDRMVIYSAIALQDVSLDSIIIRHRIWDNGPQRLRISLALDLTGVYTEIYDGPIDGAFTWLVLNDLGFVQQQPGFDQNGFQIKFQAYGGGDGAWVLDEMKIVVSEIDAITTAIPVHQLQEQQGRSMPVDLLGRTVSNGSMTGTYFDRQKRIIVVR
jgi:hypothetical protein